MTDKLKPPKEVNKWYIFSNGKVQGPTSIKKLKELAVDLQVFQDDQVWNPLMGQWMVAGDVNDLLQEEKKSLIDEYSGNYDPSFVKGKKKYRTTGGHVPGIASFFLPGLGQLIDQRTEVGLYFIFSNFILGAINIFIFFNLGDEGKFLPVVFIICAIQFFIWLVSIIDASATRQVED